MKNFESYLEKAYTPAAAIHKSEAIATRFDKYKKYNTNNPVLSNQVPIGSILQIAEKLKFDFNSSELDVITRKYHISYLIEQTEPGSDLVNQQYSRAVEHILKEKKPAFFYIAGKTSIDSYHYAIIALVPDHKDPKSVNVVYLNSMVPDESLGISESLEHIVGKNYARDLIEYIKENQAKLNIELLSEDFLDLSVENQFHGSCGLSVGTNMASVVEHYEAGKDIISLKDSLLKQKTEETILEYQKRLEEHYVRHGTNLFNKITEYSLEVDASKIITSEYVDIYTDIIIKNELGGREEKKLFLNQEFGIGSEKARVAILPTLPILYRSTKNYIENTKKDYSKYIKDNLIKALYEVETKSDKKFKIIIPYNREGNYNNLIEIIIDKNCDNELSAKIYDYKNNTSNKNSPLPEVAEIIEKTIKEFGRDRNIKTEITCGLTQISEKENSIECGTRSHRIIMAENVIRRIQNQPLTTEHNQEAGANSLREKHNYKIKKYSAQDRFPNPSLSISAKRDSNSAILDKCPKKPIILNSNLIVITAKKNSFAQKLDNKKKNSPDIKSSLSR